MLILQVAQDGAFAVLVNYESTSFPLLGDMQYLDSKTDAGTVMVVEANISQPRCIMQTNLAAPWLRWFCCLTLLLES